jgi:hypothetical protein
MNRILGMARQRQFLLRLPPELLNEIRMWAQDESRSTNAQIEYLLRQAVQHNKPEEASHRYGEANDV